MSVCTGVWWCLSSVRRARHGVLAVPADVGVRLPAIGDQKAQRKGNAAQGALELFLHRPWPSCAA